MRISIKAAIQKVAQKVASTAPTPTFRVPTAAKSNPFGAFSPNL